MSIIFSLKNNAIDYMERAIESYNQNDYKGALNNLWASLLLFFKYKLFLIHPAFIYSDIMDCVEIEGDYFISEKTIKQISESHQFSSIAISTLESYQGQKYQNRDLLIDDIKTRLSLNDQKVNIIKKSISVNRNNIKLVEPSMEKDFKTITYQDIENRLLKLGEKDSLFFDYRNEFRQLQKLRNRIEHYIYDLDKNKFLLIFHNIMPFINDFIEYELDENAEELFSNWSEFIAIDSLAKSRIETVKKYIENNSLTYRDIAHGEDYPLTCDCPSCGNTMILRDEKMFCKFCGIEENFNVCIDCHEVFPENGYETFIEDIELCADCYNDRVERFE